MRMQENTLSDILSAEDGAPVFAPQYSAYSNFSGGIATNDPLAGKPAFGLDFAASDTAVLPDVKIQTLGGAAPAAPTQADVAAGVNLTQPAGGLQGAWYWLRNQVQYGIPGLFTSASTRLRSLFGFPTTVTTSDAKTGATSTSTASSSWLVYVFLAGAAAAAFFAFKGKGKGGKSFLPKLGAKSSVKLH